MYNNLVMYIKYFNYVVIHKYYVFIECVKLHMFIHALTHDLSKFRPSEFFTYANFFYGNGESFKDSWFRHYSRNKHHHQYWVDVNGNAVEMPIKYIKQMVADMRAMSRVFGNTPAEYYSNNILKFNMHPKSRKYFETMINYRGSHQMLIENYINDMNDIVTINDVFTIMNCQGFRINTLYDGYVSLYYYNIMVGKMYLTIRKGFLFISDIKTSDSHSNFDKTTLLNKKIVFDNKTNVDIKRLIHSKYMDSMKGVTKW